MVELDLDSSDVGARLAPQSDAMLLLDGGSWNAASGEGTPSAGEGMHELSLMSGSEA